MCFEVGLECWVELDIGRVRDEQRDLSGDGSLDLEVREDVGLRSKEMSPRVVVGVLK